MKTIPAPLLAHMRGELSTLAVCWIIEKHNGGLILSTEHDRDIVIESGEFAGRYRSVANINASDMRSTSDFAVDNMEVDGALSDDVFEIPDITVAEIEAGVLDNAPVRIFTVNYNAPNTGQKYDRRGYLGIPQRDSDGVYRVEVRGLMQRLQQQIGWTYGERCNVEEFGDARCGYYVAAAMRAGIVIATDSRRHFVIDITSGDPPPVEYYFYGARLTFVTGPNAGFAREVKRTVVNSDGTLDVFTWEEFPNDPSSGDTFQLPPGCNRTLSMCADVYDNAVNFRGYGVFIPGVLELLRGPT